MNFNEKLPEWHKEGIEPPESKKTEGWSASDRPPAEWFNWLFHRTYKVFQEIRNVLGGHVDATAPHSGHETPAGAQAKANTAEANAKSYTDTHEQKAAPHSGHETPAGAQEKVTTHENKTSTHGATSAATANRIIIRDASGRAKVAAPSATDDIARKDTVDTVQADLDAHKADYTTQITLIKDKIGIAPFVKSWEEVQAIVRAGLAEEYFEIGDQFLGMYNGEVTVWTVIGINHDTPTDESRTYSITIQTRDCLENVQFDAPEPTNPDTNRQQYGSNNYMESAIRQWLNSNESQFNWVAKTQYDEPPTSSNYNGAGFLYNLDQELVAVLGAVDKQVACNTVTDGGGQDTFSDKIFLLSRVEVGLGTEGVTDGEVVYPYYDGISDAGRIKLLNNSPRYWWLRSPYVSNSYGVRLVDASGIVGSSNAYIAYGLSPACCII